MGTDGHTNPDRNSVAKTSWHLRTVQQVKDLKQLLRLSSLWASSLFISISIGIQYSSLTVLQALTMDRPLGSHFSVPAGSLTVPAGSLTVFLFSTVTLVLPLVDRLFTLTDKTPTPLQCLGLGHILNTASAVISALIERRRFAIDHAHNATGNPTWTVPMPVMWQVLPMAATGLGEVKHFPAQVAFYYQEFPSSMRSTATGVVALLNADCERVLCERRSGRNCEEGDGEHGCRIM